MVSQNRKKAWLCRYFGHVIRFNRPSCYDENTRLKVLHWLWCEGFTPQQAATIIYPPQN